MTRRNILLVTKLVQDTVWNTMLSPVLYYCIIFQDPQQDSGSAGTKIILDASENDTKENFQENIPGKKQFQKK